MTAVHDVGIDPLEDTHVRAAYRPDMDDLPLDELLKRVSLTHARRTYRELILRAEAEAWSYQEFLTMLLAEEVAHREQTLHAPSLDEAVLDGYLSRLNFQNARFTWRAAVAKAEKHGLTYADLLATFVREEVDFRHRAHLARCAHAARFPFLETLERFEFADPPPPTYSAFVNRCLTPAFVAEGQCLLIHGPPRSGKTHLAIAVAYRAIEHGYAARFVPGSIVFAQMSAAMAEGRTRSVLAEYTQPDVLVIDDAVQPGQSAQTAQALYLVLDERRRTRSATILTSFFSATAWGGLLHHPELPDLLARWIHESGFALPVADYSARTPSSTRFVPPARLAPRRTGRAQANAQRGELRAWPRKEISVEVTVASDHNFFLGFSSDISEGGLFIATYSPLPIGSRVAVMLTVPRLEREVRVACVVRWVRSHGDGVEAPPGMGVQFLDLDELALKAIRQFSSAREPIFWA